MFCIKIVNEILTSIKILLTEKCRQRDEVEEDHWVKRNRNEAAKNQNKNRAEGQENLMQQFVDLLVGAFQNRNHSNPHANVNPPSAHEAS